MYRIFVMSLSLISWFLVSENLWKWLSSIRENTLYVVSNQFFPIQPNALVNNFPKNERKLSLYITLWYDKYVFKSTYLVVFVNISFIIRCFIFQNLGLWLKFFVSGYAIYSGRWIQSRTPIRDYLLYFMKSSPLFALVKLLRKWISGQEALHMILT